MAIKKGIRIETGDKKKRVQRTFNEETGKFEEKTKRVTAPVNEQRQREAAEFVKQREKLKSKGLSHEEASNQAVEQLKDISPTSVSVEEFNRRRMEKLRAAGILKGEDIEQPAGIEFETKPTEETPKGDVSSILGIPTTMGQFGPNFAGSAAEQAGRLLTEPTTEARRIASGIALTAAVGVGWLAGGIFYSGLKGAVQAGTTLSSAGKIGSAVLKLGLGAYGLWKTGEGIAGFLGRTEVIEEQQQALNTIGQESNTILADAKTGAGDPVKSLQQLEYARNEILKYEQQIQEGKIANITMRWNGKIFDINADIADQLSTINGNIRELRGFILQGLEPELDIYELQALARNLEAQGLIEPVNFEEARRPIELGL